MSQGTKRYVILPDGWSWAQLTTVWKVVVMKKCTLAFQEFLERSLNEGYYKVLGNSTGKWRPWLDLKLARWQRFVRIWRPSLQTTACLKTGWGQTARRQVLQFVNQVSLPYVDSIPPPSSYSPILPFSPASPPFQLHLLHLPILIPLPLQEVTEILWDPCGWGKQDLGDDRD